MWKDVIRNKGEIIDWDASELVNHVYCSIRHVKNVWTYTFESYESNNGDQINSTNSKYSIHCFVHNGDKKNISQ